MKKRPLYIIQAAVTAALYCVLTILAEPIATGPIQFRVSEGLVLLPALMPAAVPGLWLGCVLANFLTGLGWVDMVFGGLATLAAAVVTRLIAKHGGLLPEQNTTALTRRDLLKRKTTWLLPLPSILFNALIVGAYLPLVLPNPNHESLSILIPVSMGQLAVSEGVVVYILGVAFFTAVYPIVQKNRRLFA